MPLDPVAALMLDEAGAVEGRVLVVDDAGGALTRAAADAGAEVLTWCDDLRQMSEVPPEHRILALPRGWVPDLVLWRLPRAVSAVEHYAEHLAPRVAPGARIIAGGRIKHMTPAQNTALARQFTEVSASLGRQKSRVLRASAPRPRPPRWPQRRYLREIGLTVIAHGSVFATNRLDDGTRLLVRTLARVAGEPDAAASRGVALDLGSGSGILAAWLAQRNWATQAIDVTASAVASTRLTARANGVQVATRRGDGLTGVAAESVDLLVSNPPFHVGGAKDSTPTLRMIEQAGPVLRPGGELWLVFNAHLPYLPLLRKHVGITTIEAQDRHYLVTRSLKDPG
ncbi:MAG: methyltransferase [Propioniciclava sp.]|uniref:class I SAM-dependent methyltransferase n=1 Tax=Propioniciclava sp. TaxID=2038686 RepID=UPI0039E4B1DB